MNAIDDDQLNMATQSPGPDISTVISRKLYGGQLEQIFDSSTVEFFNDIEWFFSATWLNRKESGCKLPQKPTENTVPCSFKLEEQRLYQLTHIYN